MSNNTTTFGALPIGALFTRVSTLAVAIVCRKSSESSATTAQAGRAPFDLPADARVVQVSGD
jgi:hypothetical protein